MNGKIYFFDIFVVFIVLVIATLLIYFGISISNMTTVQYFVDGKVSDVVYIPQSYATDMFKDHTIVTFYSGNSINFIGNNSDSFKIGINYNIIYHKVFYWWGIGNRIYQIMEIDMGIG
jgi:hypothetical protein